jgi:hypothetical protein
VSFDVIYSIMTFLNNFIIIISNLIIGFNVVGPVNFQSSPLEERSGGVEHEGINRPNLATNIVNITLLAIVLIGLIGCCFAAAARCIADCPSGAAGARRTAGARCAPCPMQRLP